MLSLRSFLFPVSVEKQKHIKLWLKIGLIFISLGAMYSPSLIKHMKNSADPFVFNDDARHHIPPFLRYYDTDLFPDDYISKYYLALLPIGYRILYTVGAVIWNPIALSNALPYVLLSILLTVTALAAGRISGMVAAWAAMAFCLSSHVFLAYMVGGLSRAFAYPLFACAALALVYGKIYLLSIVVCLAAAFYPPMAVGSGLALALLLLLLPDRDRGDASGWSLRRRFAVVTVTAMLTALITLPTALHLRAYGRMLGPSDVSDYPEVGPGGRYPPYARAPYKNLFEDLSDHIPDAFYGSGKAWVPALRTWVDRNTAPGHPSSRRKAIITIIQVLILFGFVRLVFQEPSARRLVVLLTAMCIAQVASRLLDPYLYTPHRYMLYSVPMLSIIMFPAAAGALPGMLGNFGKHPWIKNASVLILCVLCLIFLGGRCSENASLFVRIDRSQKIYTYISSLPSDAIIAGWPAGLMENVPYFSHRQAFVTLETHQAFHRGYVEEMRRRMRALIDAYFATTFEPISRLRNEFGVTHLVIDQKHYYSQRPPYYFKPFDVWTRRAHAMGLKGGFEIIRQLNVARLFQDGPLVVLDLTRLKQKADEDAIDKLN